MTRCAGPRLRRTRRSGEAGFTYVEVLIAGAVALVGLLGVMASFPRALSTVDYAGRVSTLNHMAVEKLDELRALGFGHSDLTAGPHPTLVSSGSSCYYPVAGYDTNWSLRWIVTDDTPEANMKQVVVEATYRLRYTIGAVAIPDTSSRTVTMRTWIAQ